VPEQKNRGGRPRSLIPSSKFSIYLPVSELDSLCRIASRSGVSVNVTIRTLLKREIAAVRAGKTEPITKP
jgi:hypothetical protein